MDQTNTSANEILPFIKEVAKYFMDFLETDFHKRRNPKRSIQYRSSSNLLVGINLNKYPKFSTLLWKTLSRSFDRNILNTVKKGIYRTDIPKDLLNLIELQVGKVENKEIQATVEQIAEEVKKNTTSHRREYDQALDNSIEEAKKIFRKNLVTPFISSIEKSLENLKLSDENDIFLMEEELASVLVETLESKIAEIIKLIIAKEEVDIQEELISVTDSKSVRANIVNFFQGYKVGDLFGELYEVDRNRAILDKQEFYIYFCDITYSQVKYPIFYIPVSIEKEGDSLYLEFDSQIYINKRALEYITQEYNQANGKKGNLQQIGERILYLANYENHLVSGLQSILDEITNFFELDKSVSLLDPDPQKAKSFFVNVSNTCYISLFDKSDEALVNDYEKILELLDVEDSVLANAFSVLIDDFIHKDPISYNPEVEQEWDEAGTVDKLVFSSPVPLNSEQLQILQALGKDGCKYVTVEGPPGTGKSHTITAIAFDGILKGNSVLVLSDKKEALDVVEDKITETLNRVRHDRNFQNPILRLGKTGNTYSKILSAASIEQIKIHFRAVRKEKDNLETEQLKRINSLREDLEAEKLSYQDISLDEVKELLDLESYYVNTEDLVGINELLNHSSASELLEELRNNLIDLTKRLSDVSDYLDLINLDINNVSNTADFLDYVIFSQDLVKAYEKLKVIHGDRLELLILIENISDDRISKLEEYLDRYGSEKLPIIGYWFKGKQLEEIDKLFRIDFGLPTSYEAHKKLDELTEIVFVGKSVNEFQKEHLKKEYKDFNLLGCVRNYLINGNLLSQAKQFSELSQTIEAISEVQKEMPETTKLLEIDSYKINSLLDNKLSQMTDSEFDKLIRYLYLHAKVNKDFSNISETDYQASMKALEALTTTQTTYEVDRRLISFYENNKATATTLRNIIRSKQKFPKKEFMKLREAFPCILAGIRDYAEFIPLEPEIFDLVIIDEASQVSIAQAFPALLRAKQVLILGDRKQFSNVKSSQARSDTNREYLNSIRDVFKKSITLDESKLVKLDKFNIKTSILDFFEFITNYRTQLLKHFRGYKELISYSNRYFYQDNLQVMKIRGKNINQVLEFSVIDHDGKEELIKNTNTLEAEFILNELNKLKEENQKVSVGIITPHTNQQKLLVEKINESDYRDYFFNELKLKIMTFDTCQGEERDIIFYSMVATKNDDRLWGVFVRDLNNVDIEDEGKIKAQRLNVGFSRAKEKMHFILSKPITEFSGSIGEALRHYQQVHKEAGQEHGTDETDQNSGMESNVLNWFYQTNFWKENKDLINFKPSFEMGKYLKQLDRMYNHPAYVVDFLLTYTKPDGKEVKIIIEYDGFKEHFIDLAQVNESNYQYYYSDQDIYRQKILESYGYKFLRINKFNIGQNPITTLNERIQALISEKAQISSSIKNIHSTIDGLNNGQVKECPKCKEIRTLEEFRDSDLITNFGRFCKHCKNQPRRSSAISSAQYITHSDKTCPKCGSKMTLRSGKYGKFYGCSRFPYCRGTKKYK